MKGVILHLIVMPEKHIKLDLPTSPIAEAEGVQQALACFRTVLDHSLRLELDHQIAYFAHYEYARLLTKLGPEHHAEARTHLAAVLEGKVQLGPSKGKGKVSLQNVAVIRANAASESRSYRSRAAQGRAKADPLRAFSAPFSGSAQGCLKYYRASSSVVVTMPRLLHTLLYMTDGHFDYDTNLRRR